MTIVPFFKTQAGESVRDNLGVSRDMDEGKVVVLEGIGPASKTASEITLFEEGNQSTMIGLDRDMLTKNIPFKTVYCPDNGEAFTVRVRVTTLHRSKCARCKGNRSAIRAGTIFRLNVKGSTESGAGGITLNNKIVVLTWEDQQGRLTQLGDQSAESKVTISCPVESRIFLQKGVKGLSKYITMRRGQRGSQLNRDSLIEVVRIKGDVVGNFQVNSVRLRRAAWTRVVPALWEVDIKFGGTLGRTSGNSFFVKVDLHLESVHRGSTDNNRTRARSNHGELERDSIE